MIKDFIKRTKPKGKMQITQTIKDIDKQINYLKSIGKDAYAIEYWGRQKLFLEERLERIKKNDKSISKSSGKNNLPKV